MHVKKITYFTLRVNFHNIDRPHQLESVSPYNDNAATPKDKHWDSSPRVKGSEKLGIKLFFIAKRRGFGGNEREWSGIYV